MLTTNFAKHINLKSCRIFIISAMLIITSPSYAQKTGSQNWQQELTTLMDKFMDCAATSSDKSQCSAFIGESIARVYKLNTFYSDKLHRYLLLNEISKPLVEKDEWTMLGRAIDQKTLTEAQRIANLNKAVIAVYTTPAGIGHIALVLPGELHYSGSWGYNVPNSASFFTTETEKSYVGKALSYAFARNMIKDVVLYCSK